MMDYIKSVPLELVAIGVFALSFLTTYITIPRIILLVQQKGLVDVPNDRSSHTRITPTLGGIAFYLSLILSFFLIDLFIPQSHLLISIAAGLTILFFIGVKDDLVALSPRTKVISQLLATIILMTNQELVINSFNGFLGVDNISLVFSFLISCFLMLSIVNSYNLIDGINGSAAIVGIVIFSIYLTLFITIDLYFYALLSIVCLGFLFAFLRYNLSVSKKIFMGDTGSLIIGFVLGVMTLRFFSLSSEQLEILNIYPANKFILGVGILFIPCVDTGRVFTIRLLDERSPFSPDRNHIHHIMIDYMKLSHPKASLMLGGINLLAFLILYFSNFHLEYLYLLLLLFLIIGLFVGVLFYFNKNIKTRKTKYKLRKIFEHKRE